MDTHAMQIDASQNIPFSIVIPLYNKKEHIQRTIGSILDQAYENFEIIVVNDGSTDGGEQLVEDYQCESIKLINQPNSGVSVARNNGFKQARYDYVCLLDADDEWLPGFLQSMSDLINTFPGYNLYLQGHEIVEENGKILTPNVDLPHDFKGVTKNFIHLYANGDGIVHPSASCLKKDYFLEIGGFPPGQGYGEDVYLWLRYALQTDIVFSNRVGARYHRDADNRSIDRVIRTELPYQFVYYYDYLQQKFTHTDDRDSANKNKELVRFLRKDGLTHIAGLKASGQNKSAKLHAKLLYQHDKLLGLICLLISIFPDFILKQVKAIRNSMRTRH